MRILVTGAHGQLGRSLLTVLPETGHEAAGVDLPDGDLADEQLLRDYHVNFDQFGLGNDSAPESRTLMAWAVNVRANEDHLGAATAPTGSFRPRRARCRHG